MKLLSPVGIECHPIRQNFLSMPDARRERQKVWQTHHQICHTITPFTIYRPDYHSHHCAEVATPHHRSPTCPPPTHATHLSNMLFSCFPAPPPFTNPAPACSPPYTPAFNMSLTTYPTTAQTIARLPPPHPPIFLSDLLFPSLSCGRLARPHSCSLPLTPPRSTLAWTCARTRCLQY